MAHALRAVIKLEIDAQPKAMTLDELIARTEADQAILRAIFQTGHPKPVPDRRKQ